MGVCTVVGHRRSELDDLGLRLVLSSGGLFTVLAAQEAKFQKVRFDVGRMLFLIVVGRGGRMTARQGRMEAVRHGNVWSGAGGLAFRSLQSRFSIETARGRSLRRGHGLVGPLEQAGR